MNPNGSSVPVLALEFPTPSNPNGPAQIGLFPAPVPAPFVFVEQPVQDVLRLARPVVTVWAEPFL